LPAEIRLDNELVARGLARSRNQAQALIRDGLVMVAGLDSPKPSSLVAESTIINLNAEPPFVSRAANKLMAAFAAFQLPSLENLAVIDIGASTGGFTQVALRHSAQVVVSVDVGRGQLAQELVLDDRVISLEATDARSLTLELLKQLHLQRFSQDLPDIGLVTIDVSFISVTHLLPVLFELFPAANFVVLIKPQFEVGKHRLGRGGIVSNQQDHRSVLARVALLASELRFAVRGAIKSPIQGTQGNTEYLLWITKQVPNDERELASQVPSWIDPLFV